MEERVLVVEDDESMRQVISMGLEHAGFVVKSERDGRRALDLASQEDFDLVLLDVMLPTVDGFWVCREMRSKDKRTPIVMLTAKAETADIVIGLESGADDYITKPFDMRELLARVHAVLRRVHEPSQGDSVMRINGVEIDAAAYRVVKDGEEVALTKTEFSLLFEFAQHGGQVLTREVLLDRIWDYDYLGDSKIVDMAVKRLRDKIEDDPSHPRLITTVRGVGYRLEGA